MNKFIALTLGDLRNIRRDSILLLVLTAPVIFVFLLRFGIPSLSNLLLEEVGFSLESHNQLIFIFFTMLLPLLFGMVSGFLLLDEHDEHVLTYISITPVTKTGYLLQKLLFPTITIFLFSFIFGWITDLVSFEFFSFTPVALMLSLEAPMMALFLVAFAENKVEGMALSKVAGVLLFAPVAGYFVHSPLRYLAGISPTFWASEVFLARDGMWISYFLAILAGFLVHAGYLYYLWKKFARKIG